MNLEYFLRKFRLVRRLERQVREHEAMWLCKNFPDPRAAPNR